jgi:hypothetical protein
MIEAQLGFATWLETTLDGFRVAVIVGVNEHEHYETSGSTTSAASPGTTRRTGTPRRSRSREDSKTWPSGPLRESRLKRSRENRARNEMSPQTAVRGSPSCSPT